MDGGAAGFCHGFLELLDGGWHCLKLQDDLTHGGLCNAANSHGALLSGGVCRRLRSSKNQKREFEPNSKATKAYWRAWHACARVRLRAAALCSNLFFACADVHAHSLRQAEDTFMTSEFESMTAFVCSRVTAEAARWLSKVLQNTMWAYTHECT